MSLLHFCAWEHFSYVAIYAGLESALASKYLSTVVTTLHQSYIKFIIEMCVKELK